MKNNAIKKVTKRFSDFSKEEEWLQSMLNEGWILKGYDSEDIGDCHYIFERTQSEKSHNIIYKIDFRNFDKRENLKNIKRFFKILVGPCFQKASGIPSIFFIELPPQMNKAIFFLTRNHI
ncbi:DUF2812 domain-containing protein [Niallia circulans]